MKRIFRLFTLTGVLMCFISCQMTPADYMAPAVIPGEYTSWPYGTIPEYLSGAEKEEMIEKTILWLEENNKTFWGALTPDDYNDYRKLFNSINGDMNSSCTAIEGREQIWNETSSYINLNLEQFATHGEIMGALTRLTYNLNEGHSLMIPDRLAGTNTLMERAPVINLINYGMTRMGAWVVINENDEIIIAMADQTENPYNFSPGDKITAVNGIPWKEWREPLENSSLPIKGSLGGNERARELNWLKGITMNITLFNYITVERISGREEVLQIRHTDPVYKDVYDIIPIPQIETQTLNNSYAPLTTGLLDDTNIGYIKIRWFEQDVNGNLLSWDPYQTRFSSEFKSSIELLQQTEGLIIDLRGHSGGMWQIIFDGWSLLTENSQETLFFKAYEKINGQLKPASEFEKQYRQKSLDIQYNHPIIILTDSHCLSGGDFFTNIASRFSNVTVLGEAHNGSFCGIITKPPYKIGNTAIKVLYTQYIWKDLEGNYPLRRNFIDEEINYNREDISRGEDTYIKRAMEIINGG